MTLTIQLTKKQSEFDRAIERYPVVLFGGGRGGGKSHGLRLIMLKRRIQYPNSIGYLFRKTFPELEANHISPLFAQFPALREFYNEGKKTLRLPNGSELRFAFCEHERDISKFQGREIHDLAIEEAGDWQEHCFELLRASNRSSLPHIKPRTILTANPGGVGHKFLKRLFIERNFRDGENPDDYFFIPALVRDNPALMRADPLYAERLKGIKNETLRRAWLEGDWDITAGTYFNQLNRRVHLIKPFKIPPHWKWFGGYDYGFNHPAVWSFWVSDEDGNHYCVKEIYQARLGIDDQANRVHEILEEFVQTKQKTDRSIIFHAGHDCWAVKKAGDPTIAEDFIRRKIVLARANINRKLGAKQCREYLGNETRKPRAFFFETASKIFDCIERMVNDPNDVEDVLKVDSVEGDPNTGDDGYDGGFRYPIMSRPPIALPVEKPILDRYRKTQSQTGSWLTS